MSFREIWEIGSAVAERVEGGGFTWKVDCVLV